GIVNRSLVAKGNHPHNAALKFINGAPEPKTIMLLRLNPQGVLNYADAPFFFQVRPFSHNLVLEVIRKAVIFKDHVNAYYMTFQQGNVTTSITPEALLGEKVWLQDPIA